MRKPVLAICEQQRCRSACTPPQSDQHLCCSLLRYYNTSSFYIQNFKTLVCLCNWAGRFESYLEKNPKTGFLVTRLHLFCSPEVMFTQYRRKLESGLWLTGNKVFTQYRRKLESELWLTCNKGNKVFIQYRRKLESGLWLTGNKVFTQYRRKLESGLWLTGNKVFTQYRRKLESGLWLTGNKGNKVFTQYRRKLESGLWLTGNKVFTQYRRSWRVRCDWQVIKVIKCLHNTEESWRVGCDWQVIKCLHNTEESWRVGCYWQVIKCHSVALANIKGRLIGWHQNLRYIIFLLLMSGFTSLTPLDFGKKQNILKGKMWKVH